MPDPSYDDGLKQAKQFRGQAGVYFITSEGGPIKIGMSQDVGRRLRTLQTGYPHQLLLVGLVNGGAGVEREYHRRFAAHRLNGEWFAPHPDIVAEIDRLLDEEGL